MRSFLKCKQNNIWKHRYSVKIYFVAENLVVCYQHLGIFVIQVGSWFTKLFSFTDFSWDNWKANDGDVPLYRIILADSFPDII